MKLSYKCAGSQQSKDFRNINNIDANEIKKSLRNVDEIRAIGKRYNKNKMTNLPVIHHI